jgi:uncharacterized membrane-anchored protein
VRWAFEAKEDDSIVIVNSVALALARDGFEKLTWIGSKDALGDGLLNVGLGSFSLPPGKQYSDFKAGDTVAEYGIAGLVAVVLGAKVAGKIGLLAAAALIFKKFGVFAIAAIGASVTWLWRKLGRGNPRPPVR